MGLNYFIDHIVYYPCIIKIEIINFVNEKSQKMDSIL